MCRRCAYLIVMFVAALGTGQSAKAGYADAVRKGNKAFVLKDYSTALEQYRAAETDLPTSPEIDYNIGGALFEQGKYEEAVEKFTRSLNTTDPKLAGSGHYNLGNTYYRMQDYAKAIQSYEEALKTNPKDMDAKFNLELARKMLKEHSQAQNQQQQQQNQQGQQKQQDQQNQQPKDQNKDQQQQQQQQSPEQSDQNKHQRQQKQPQGNPKDSKKMSKEDAERVLNALRDNEQDTQKKLKRQVTANDYNGKDW